MYTGNDFLLYCTAVLNTLMSYHISSHRPKGFAFDEIDNTL